MHGTVIGVVPLRFVCRLTGEAELLTRTVMQGGVCPQPVRPLRRAR